MISAATLELLVKAGIQGEALIEIARQIEADAVKPRSNNAERQARFRAKKNGGVTCNVTDNATQAVTDPSPLVPPLSPAPLTPPIIPPTLAGLGLVRDELEAKLREAAGWQNEPAPMLAVTGEIDALLGQGASLELDVLPIIKALGSQPKRRSSWKYFIGPIRDAWQARISTEATGPPVAQVVPFSQPHSGASRAKIQPKSSRSDYFATVRSRLDEAERGPSSQSDGCDGIVIEGQAG